MDIDLAVRMAHRSGCAQGRRSVLRAYRSGAEPGYQNTVCAMAVDLEAAQSMWRAHVDGLMRAAAEFSDVAKPLIGADHPLANWLGPNAALTGRPRATEGR